MKVRELHIDPRMTYGDLRRYADSLDINVSSAILGGNLKGVYDESTQTIIIDRSMPYTAKRCTLVHELVHWSWHDDECPRYFHAKNERRTRRITAELLVPMFRAEMLGDEYSGDAGAVATELDVTKQVLQDYETLVMPRRFSAI